ncbi:hypothetical protein [Laspinema palackyanum]|uniref:hypothetical protein n=1 Tax=Laspinema palackyanum TaxID=3231601 RepID=UPI003F686DB7
MNLAMQGTGTGAMLFPSPCGELIGGINPILLKPLHYLVFKVRSRQSTESQLYKT